MHATMKIPLALLSLTLTACSLSALPVTEPAPAALPSTLALSCAGCHSTVEAADGLPSPLQTMSKQALSLALLEFRSGQRQGVIMPRLSRELSDADIAVLADYYATKNAR